jgi:gentisate 1,2-dioxygenase
VRFDWQPGDSFVTPSWASVDHQAAEQADLFAISDRPVLQLLHLYREETLPEHQESSGTFVPLKGMVSATGESTSEE